jgi:hypothetical protein
MVPPLIPVTVPESSGVADWTPYEAYTAITTER